MQMLKFSSECFRCLTEVGARSSAESEDAVDGAEEQQV